MSARNTQLASTSPGFATGRNTLCRPMSPRGWVCQPKALARLDGVASVLIVAEKSIGDGLLMAKKWPPALSTNALPGRCAARPRSRPISESIASNPRAPSAPALWFMVADPTATEFRASGGSAGTRVSRQIVRSDRTTDRSPNSPESARNSTNTSTGPKTATSARQWRQ